VPADSFLDRLREARDVPSPDTQCSPAGRTFLADEVPAELANQPRYRVIRLLGRGGMGAVYLAEHRRMGRLVALKVIHPEFLNHAGALLRFAQEVKAAAQLDHPNIVAAYDADQAGELHFLVMEHVEGRNLADYLAETGPLPVAQACDIIRQAALGLQHAHQRGMVHRDIKPHNLMLTPAGQVKVLDFGLARFATETPGAATADAGSASPPLTGAGAVMGTADYIAPEQVQNAHLADGRSDVYGLGCTLYHLLTGRPPFPHGSPREKLRRHTTDPPPEPRELRGEIPEGLARVVATMTAKRPQDRYQTAEEAAVALRACAPGVEPASTPRRPRWVIAAVLFAGTCAGGAGWWARTQDGKGEQGTQKGGAAEERFAPEKAGEVRRWQGHGNNPVFRIVISPDGRSAWSVANDFRRWDVATGTTVQRVVTPLRLEELLPSPDGKQFLTMEEAGG
jgi:hypothetical protein